MTSKILQRMIEERVASALQFAGLSLHDCVAQSHCPVDAELLEANFRRATAVLHDEMAEMKGVLAESSEAAADKLEQMQRSQIYLEQKLLHEIATEKTALEKVVQQADACTLNLEAKVDIFKYLG